MVTRESGPGGVSRTLRGPQAIAEAGQAARAFGDAQRLGPDDVARLSIVVEELVANLFDHGGLVEDDLVELHLESEEGGTRIVLFDRGKPFDPRSARPARKRSERGGGAGIEIVRAWAEIIRYSADSQGNRLTLLLPTGPR